MDLSRAGPAKRTAQWVQQLDDHERQELCRLRRLKASAEAELRIIAGDIKRLSMRGLQRNRRAKAKARADANGSSNGGH